MPLELYYFLSITAVNILLSWALYLPYRVAHLHFITVANMAISGYAAAWLVMALHVPFGWALLVGFALGGIIGFIVSLFIGDAPTFAVVIVGFTFIFISRTVIENLKAVGGTMGMFGLPNIGGSPDAHRWIIMAILAALLLFVGLLLHRFDHSRLGRAASAVFVDKDLAASLGVDIRRLGMLLQTVSCTIAGGTGVLYGFIYRSLHLDFFTFALVGIAMTIIFVGGYATQWGTVVLAPILYGVPLLFPPAIQEWRIVIYGAAPRARPGPEARGVHHAAIRRFHRILSFGKPEEKKYSIKGGHMKKALGVLIVAAALLAIVGCQQPAPKEWDIPFLNSLTGPIASIGEYLEWGADEAAKEINAAGRDQRQAREDHPRGHRHGPAEGLHRDGAPCEGHARRPRTRA